jgi:hypothetical protein
VILEDRGRQINHLPGGRGSGEAQPHRQDLRGEEIPEEEMNQWLRVVEGGGA